MEIPQKEYSGSRPEADELGASLTMIDVKDLLEGHVFDFERSVTRINQPFKCFGEELLVNEIAKVDIIVEV